MESTSAPLQPFKKPNSLDRTPTQIVYHGGHHNSQKSTESASSGMQCVNLSSSSSKSANVTVPVSLLSNYCNHLQSKFKDNISAVIVVGDYIKASELLNERNVNDSINLVRNKGINGYSSGTPRYITLFITITCL